MPERLAGKVVVVIGGTGGLGLSAVRACLAAGARVVAVGLEEAGAQVLNLEAPGRVHALVADATEPATAERALAEADRRFGGFHGLYHVAGGSGRRQGDGPLHELTDAGWEYTLRLNLTSVMYSNRAAVRYWLARGAGGTVLNCGSVLARSPSPELFATHAYAAAKAALEGLTRAAAARYAPHNIRFNVLAPGLVATPMSARAQGDPAILDFIRRKQPLDGGRIARTEDLDAAAVFFLSDESRFVTGQVLAVDGGWSVSEGRPPVHAPGEPPGAHAALPRP
jgi:NAD(P)-dependent dehydrogenase (short-subunit alcohol dehydrogenase family)